MPCLTRVLVYDQMIFPTNYALCDVQRAKKLRDALELDTGTPS